MKDHHWAMHLFFPAYQKKPLQTSNELIAAANGAYITKRNIPKRLEQTKQTPAQTKRRCIMLYNETASPQNKSSENTHINQFAAAAVLLES
jgi:hypothetical protein